MGADIVVEVRRRPQWRNSLEATREQLTRPNRPQNGLPCPWWRV